MSILNTITKPIMIRLNFSNYRSHLYPGAKVIVGESVGIAKADSAYRGEYRIGGRSIENILDEEDEVFLFDNVMEL